MESGWNYIVIRGIYIPHFHYVLDHNHSGASTRPMLKYILHFHITLEKNGYGDTIPRKWSRIIAAKSNTLGNILQLLWKKIISLQSSYL